MDIQYVLRIVILIVIIPIALGIGAITVFTTTGNIDASTGRTSVAIPLSNTDFSENTTGILTSWDNMAEGAAAPLVEGQYAEIRVTDNGIYDGLTTVERLENVWYYQDTAISSLLDGYTSATVSFQYRLIDNENLKPGDAIRISAYLYTPLGENLTVRDNIALLAESATWTSVENSVIDNITGAGTYILYIRVGITPDPSNEQGTDVNGSLIRVGLDNVNFSIGAYGRGYLENAITEVESNTKTGFDLGAQMPLVVAGIGLITILAIGFLSLYKKTE